MTKSELKNQNIDTYQEDEEEEEIPSDLEGLMAYNGVSWSDFF